MSKPRFTSIETDLEGPAFQEAAQLLLRIQKEKMPAILVACTEVAGGAFVSDVHHIRMNNQEIGTTMVMVASMVDMLTKGTGAPLDAVLDSIRRAAKALRTGPIG